jgi:hypothetical protein
MKKLIFFATILIVVAASSILSVTPVAATTHLANTVINIQGPAAPVPAGTTITLVITENNNGSGPPEEIWLGTVWASLEPGGYILNRSNYYYGGDVNDNGRLEVGETWEWHVNIVVNADTTFTAIGHGFVINDTNYDVTYGDFSYGYYPNEKFELFVDVYCPGFGTKGYWHNKNGLTVLYNDPNFSTLLAYINGLDPYKSPSDYFNNGDEPFNGYFTDGQPVPPAIKNLTEFGLVYNEISQFLVDPNAAGGGADREQLAQQLLAFIFNVNYRLGNFSQTLTLPGGGSMTGQGIINAAIAAWNSAGTADDVYWEHILDTMNNNY